MKATVVIPNLNGIKYIENCLTSLCENTMQAKILVIDNGSTDGSLELVAERFKEVELVCFSENTGFCRAVNEGIARADTEYVILLNNDTKVEKSFIKELVLGMEEKKDAFSGSAKLLSMGDKTKIDDAGDYVCALGYAFARGKGKEGSRYEKTERIFSACAGAAIYRRALFEQIGVFDEAHFAYLEDVDIGYRAQIAGFHNYIFPKAVVYHAGSAVSGSKHNAFKVRLAARNTIYMLYKNMPLPQMILNLPFLLPGFLIKYLFFCKKNLGKSYRQGIAEGIANVTGKEKKVKKVICQGNNFFHYVEIQLELWANLFLLF